MTKKISNMENIAKRFSKNMFIPGSVRAGLTKPECEELL